MITRSTLLLLVLFLFTGICHSTNKMSSNADRKILVDKYEDRRTGCKITYEYYKNSEGKKIMHGKYKRQWSVPKNERNIWSGSETVTATFIENRLNGAVVVNSNKQKWKKKNEYIKGKGRKVSMVAVESVVARNLKIDVKNDTLCGSFNFQLGNLKYETTGKVNEQGEMVGIYTVYKRVNEGGEVEMSKRAEDEWTIFEQYLCDPDYTYKDATPKITEIDLGYNGTSRGEQIRIKIPRLRLSITPL